MRKQLISRGKYWYKYEWYSMCSIHYKYNKDCKICNSGSWVNVWKNYIDNIIYDICPKLWQNGFRMKTISKEFEPVSTYLQKQDRLGRLNKLKKLSK